MKKMIWILLALFSLMLIPLTANAEWVYIGKYGAEGAISSGFRIDRLPEIGETIYAIQGMHLRDAAPHIKNGKWRFGKAINVLHRGQAITVEELALSRKGAAPGDVWARGTVQR